MLDPKRIRAEPEAVARLLRKRGFALDTGLLAELDERRRSLQLRTEALQGERKTLSQRIGRGRAAGGETDAADLEAVRRVKEELESGKEALERCRDELHRYLLSVPNIPDDAVPEGDSERDNRVTGVWGEPPRFDFSPRDHVALGESLGGLDFAAAAGMSGARFAVMRGAVARLHRALIQFMLDLHTREHGYTELNVPHIVNAEALEGTGQLPKFGEDLFRLDAEGGRYLIPTAEVPVTNMVRDGIIGHERLPLKFVCHTPCYRAEAGSHGQDTRGMIRQHQFEKVELVQVTAPAASAGALEELTSHAEQALRLLELPYRKVVLCGGDMGFAAAVTFDLEVWLPSQERYREISSCSNFTDFQARRMRARWRNPDTGKPELVHTLNGSGLAAGRTLIAVLENFQDEKGRVRLPEALRPYMDGAAVLE